MTSWCKTILQLKMKLLQKLQWRLTLACPPHRHLSGYQGPEYGRTRDIRCICPSSMSYFHLSNIIFNFRSANLSPAMLTYYREPLVIHEGSMQWLWDHQGKKYLDMFGGIVTVSVGHCHPKVTSALEDQIKKLWHTTNIYLHPKVHEYAERLVATLPDPLKVG